LISVLLKFGVKLNSENELPIGGPEERPGKICCITDSDQPAMHCPILLKFSRLVHCGPRDQSR